MNPQGALLLSPRESLRRHLLWVVYVFRQQETGVRGENRGEMAVVRALFCDLMFRA